MIVVTNNIDKKTKSCRVGEKLTSHLTLLNRQQQQQQQQHDYDDKPIITIEPQLKKSLITLAVTCLFHGWKD
jgi:hypothetical protein